MKTNKLPPTIADLQSYLIQLQGVLCQREQATRAFEISKAHLAAEFERNTLEAKVRAKKESEEAKIRAKKESEEAKIRSKQESEFIRLKNKLRLDLDAYRVHFELFPLLLDEIIGYLANTTVSEEVLSHYRVVSDCIIFVPKLAELIDYMISIGIPKSDAITDIKPTSFKSLKTEYLQFERYIKDLPVSGFECWQPFLANGNRVLPWRFKDAPIWLERKSNRLWCIDSQLYQLKSAFNQQDFEALISNVNKNIFSGRSRWRLPTLEEISDLSENVYLSFIGADKLHRVWISYSNAPGLATAFHFLEGKRETTAPDDNCSIVLISSNS